jgi:hypothetical protein
VFGGGDGRLWRSFSWCFMVVMTDFGVLFCFMLFLVFLSI